MPIEQLTIVGVGLIGGSFALALKHAGFKGRIVGCDRVQVLDRALHLGAIDLSSTDPEAACRDAQIVLFSTPVSSIIDLIERLGPIVPNGLFTDVGSTKRAVTDRAKAVFGSSWASRFLPGHPIAGKEHGGIEHASADLFHRAPWIVCHSQASAEFLQLIGLVGARPVFMSPEEHDALFARTSHLPQLIATALASQLDEELSPEQLSGSAGRGLRDMTRLAESPYELWRDIALTNTDQLELALLRFEQRLAHIRENLRTRELRDEFDRAAHFRSALRKLNPDQ